MSKVSVSQGCAAPGGSWGGSPSCLFQLLGSQVSWACGRVSFPSLPLLSHGRLLSVSPLSLIRILVGFRARSDNPG